MFRSIPAIKKCLLLSILAGLYSVTPAAAIEVYFFKGAGDFSFINKNMHFSRGLDRMAAQLNKEGIHAEVRRFGSTSDALRTIRKRRPKSVAFVGHSMGALASMSMAKKMKSLGVRVAYVGTIDIPGPIGSAGKNVEWAENYFSIFPVYGKLTNTSSHTKAKNVYVFGQVHTTMDDSKKVRNGILSAIREIEQAENGAELVPDEPMMVENTVPEKVEEPVFIAQAKPRKRLLKIDEVDPDAPIQASVVASAQAQVPAPVQVPVQMNEPVKAQVIANSNSQFASTVPMLAEIKPDQISSNTGLAPMNLLAAPRINQASAPVRIKTTQPVAKTKPFSVSSLGKRGRKLIDKVSAFFARQRGN